MRRSYTSRQRSEVVDLVTTGQATVREAASRIGVTPSAAYYWLKRRAVMKGGQARRSAVLKAAAMAETTFVRVVPSGRVDGVIAVRVGGAEIQVGREFDADLLRAVVEALGGGEA